MMYSIKKTANEIIQNIIIKTLNVLYVGCFCVLLSAIWSCTVLCVLKMNSRCQHVAS